MGSCLFGIHAASAICSDTWSSSGLRDGSRVLDIGCGRGHLLQLILAQYNASGIGVDLSPYAIAEAARRGGTVKPFLNSGGTGAPPVLHRRQILHFTYAASSV